MIIQTLLTVLILMTIAYSPSMTIFATSNQADSNNEDDYSEECYDSGYNDGQNGPFSQGTYNHCGEGNGDDDDDYYKGFINGCMSVQGNTRDVCESVTDA